MNYLDMFGECPSTYAPCKYIKNGTLGKEDVYENEYGKGYFIDCLLANLDVIEMTAKNVAAVENKFYRFNFTLNNRSIFNFYYS